MNLADLRLNYTRDSLHESDMPSDPLVLFDAWLKEVVESDMPDPNAMTLATVDANYQPSQRIVLLKGRPDDKFVFFTNYGSNKARDIEGNAKVSLHFPWYAFERQVMVLGNITKLSDEENDQYFESRPKQSQVGAYVSKQSQVLISKTKLVENYDVMLAEYVDKPVPRPYWGGYAVSPHTIEFWQGGSARLHDRIRYTRECANANWQFVRLNP